MSGDINLDVVETSTLMSGDINLDVVETSTLMSGDINLDEWRHQSTLMLWRHQP
jgi:hypothetical protein